MEEAEELFFARKIYGVVYIPQDYEKQLLGGSSVAVSLYVDASYFLMYRQVFQELVTGIGQTGGHGTVPAAHRQRRRHPAGDGRDAAGHLPVAQPFHSLSGLRIVHHARDHHRHHPADAPDRHRHDRRHMARIRTLPETDPRQLQAHVHASDRAGKGIGLHLDLRRHAALHHDGALQTVPLSSNGSTEAVVGLLVPYLLACIMLGIAISTLFRYREQSLLLLFWTSIPILLLSGASFPREAIPNGSTRWGRSSRAAAASTPSSGSGRWALRCGT